MDVSCGCSAVDPHLPPTALSYWLLHTPRQTTHFVNLSAFTFTLSLSPVPTACEKTLCSIIPGK